MIVISTFLAAMTKLNNKNSTKVLLKSITFPARQITATTAIISGGFLSPITDASLEAEATATLQSYFRSLRITGISASTALKYRQCLNVYVAWLKGRPISESSAKEFLCDLRDFGFSNSTVRFYYISLRPFLLLYSISLKLKLKNPTKLPQYRSIDQVKAILAAAKNRTGKYSYFSKRDWLMLAILAYTGIRLGELLSLKPRDIDFVSKTFKIHGKGGKERIIPIHQVLNIPIKTYISIIPAHQGLFPFKAKRAWQIVFNYALLAGIHDFHPHAFRHFFATQLIERGVPLHIIQQLLGHADINTTAVYLDVLPKHLEAAVLTMPDFSN